MPNDDDGGIGGDDDNDDEDGDDIKVDKTLALDSLRRSNSSRRGWISSHTGRSSTFGQTWW